jgi:hypothetical protein
MTEIFGLNELVTDLSDASQKAQRRVPGVIRKAATNVKDDWRQRASGLAHAPLYPSSITFDTSWKGIAYEAEVGPDKDRPQGALGNLITFGSVNNAPTGHDVAVALAEEPKLAKALEDLVDL